MNNAQRMISLGFSGISEHEMIQKFAGKRLAGFVHKPYKLSPLRKAIKNMDNREDDLC